MSKHFKKVIPFILFVFFISILSANSENKSAWPPLAEIGHIKGKVATKDDVNADKAVFAYTKANSRSTPIDITIPQYALLKTEKANKNSRIIVIQAEIVNGLNMLGYINILTGKKAIALMKQVKLLGQNL